MRAARSFAGFPALTLCLAAFLAVAGCSVPQGGRAPVATWDFGPLPATSATSAAPRLSGNLMVLAVDAPAWLDSAAMLYRLAYLDAAEPRAYAASRWIAPPAALLTERLRGAIAAAGAVVLTPGDSIRPVRTLRVEIEEFGQTFDSPASSRARMRLRATVIAAGTLVAQRSFDIAIPAASADARGAATGLAQVANLGMEQLVAWLASLR